MSRIVAIEPDPERAQTLKRLVSEWVDAEVVLAESTDAAIAAMADESPDLILTSALISPADDAHLTEHLRHLPGGQYIPVLTVPPLVDPDEVANMRKKNRGLFSLFKRRQAPAWNSIWPAYDNDVLGARIKEALEGSRVAEMRDQMCLVPRIDSCEPVKAGVSNGPSLLRDVSAGEAQRALLRMADAQSRPSEMTDEELRAHCGLGPKRLRAHRWMRNDLPWLTGVKLPWGLDVRLLNISSTGMLIESGARFTPGTAAEFSLVGPNKNLTVSARVVRSQVATVDSIGVKYRAAATFDRKLDTLSTGAAPQESTEGPLAVLSDVMARVKAEAGRGAAPSELRTVFEQGIQQLVTAREIRVRDVPVVKNDGSDSIYFTVPTPDQSQAVLQATFEPNYMPRLEEFELLRAAAKMAAEILQIEESAGYALQNERSA